MFPSALHVLIIDDDDSIRTLLRLQVRHLGCEVLESIDGIDGIECACREEPDVVICDYNMPGKNGYEVWKTLRGLPLLREVPFIMITSQFGSCGGMLHDLPFLYEVRHDSKFRLLSKEGISASKIQTTIEELFCGTANAV